MPSRFLRHLRLRAGANRTNALAQSVPWRRSVRRASDVLLVSLLGVALTITAIQLRSVSAVNETGSTLGYDLLPATLTSLRMADDLELMSQTVVAYDAGDPTAVIRYYSHFEDFRQRRLELEESGAVDAVSLEVLDRRFAQFDDFARNEVLDASNITHVARGAEFFDSFTLARYGPLADQIARLKLVSRTAQVLADDLDELRSVLERTEQLDEFETRLEETQRCLDDFRAGVVGAVGCFDTSVAALQAESISLRERYEAGQATDSELGYVIGLEQLVTRYRHSAETLVESSFRPTPDLLRNATVSGDLADSVRQHLTEMAERQRDTAAGEAKRLAGLMAVMRGWLFATTALIIAVALATHLLFRRQVVDPLLSVAERIDRIRGGERGLDLQATERGSEIDLTLANLASLQETLGELEQSQANELQQIQSDHFEELKTAYDELKAKEAALRRESEIVQAVNSDLNQFAHMTSHDLREPLKKVYSFCTLLGERINPEVDEKAAHYLSRVMASVESVMSLVDDIRALTQADTLPGEVEAVDLNQLFFEVFSGRATDLDANHVSLDVDDLPTVIGNRPALTKAIGLLMDNVIQYSGRSHTVRVRVAACADNSVEIRIVNRRLARSFAHQREQALVGSGAERLLLPFVRGEATGDGNGMGLAICRRLIELQGGKLSIPDAQPSEFTIAVQLPLEANDDDDDNDDNDDDDIPNDSSDPLWVQTETPEPGAKIPVTT